ncbi:flagellar hook-length control protein FliK [Rhodobacter sp. NSM]|uniref:flagellar hook-length control protein FliK n=1 Tax=Rhodobacter sp. NSM TaxID=3457501 RepID=UPI003FD4BDB2
MFGNPFAAEAGQATEGPNDMIGALPQFACMAEAAPKEQVAQGSASGDAFACALDGWQRRSAPDPRKAAGMVDGDAGSSRADPSGLAESEAAASEVEDAEDQPSSEPEETGTTLTTDAACELPLAHRREALPMTSAAPVPEDAVRLADAAETEVAGYVEERPLPSTAAPVRGEWSREASVTNPGDVAAEAGSLQPVLAEDGLVPEQPGPRTSALVGKSREGNASPIDEALGGDAGEDPTRRRDDARWNSTPQPRVPYEPRHASASSKAACPVAPAEQVEGLGSPGAFRSSEARSDAASGQTRLSVSGQNDMRPKLARAEGPAQAVPLSRDAAGLPAPLSATGKGAAVVDQAAPTADHADDVGRLIEQSSLSVVTVASPAGSTRGRVERSAHVAGYAGVRQITVAASAPDAQAQPSDAEQTPVAGGAAPVKQASEASLPVLTKPDPEDPDRPVEERQPAAAASQPRRILSGTDLPSVPDPRPAAVQDGMPAVWQSPVARAEVDPEADLVPSAAYRSDPLPEHEPRHLDREPQMRPDSPSPQSFTGLPAGAAPDASADLQHPHPLSSPPDEPQVFQTSEPRTVADSPRGTAQPAQPPVPAREEVSATAGDAVEVVLDPDDLGRVKMTMAQEGDQLRVLVQADRSDTLDLMRRHSDQLGAELRQAGFSGASLSFGGREERSRPRAHASFAGEVADLQPSATPSRGATTGGLDLRI